MRTDEELRELSEHVLYEAQMLFATADRLRRHERGEEPLTWDLYMAVTESFAMHTRVLIEFMWHNPEEGKARRFPDDGFAADYFGGDEWIANRPEMESTLHGLWKRAGHEIAHISYKRTLNPAEREWKVDLIAGSIGRALRVFIETAEPTKLAPGFVSRLRQSWPHYLNAPIALSFPPTVGSVGAATASLVDSSHIAAARDEEFLSGGPPA